MSHQSYPDSKTKIQQSGIVRLSYHDRRLCNVCELTSGMQCIQQSVNTSRHKPHLSFSSSRLTVSASSSFNRFLQPTNRALTLAETLLFEKWPCTGVPIRLIKLSLVVQAFSNLNNSVDRFADLKVLPQARLVSESKPLWKPGGFHRNNHPTLFALFRIQLLESILMCCAVSTVYQLAIENM